MYSVYYLYESRLVIFSNWHMKTFSKILNSHFFFVFNILNKNEIEYILSFRFWTRFNYSYISYSVIILYTLI